MKDLLGDPIDQPMLKSAVISNCGRYRYSLGRRWHQGEGTVCFVMLNPSTADAMIDDPTIRRCIGFARCWGYQGIEVRNLFGLRATDPKELQKAVDPVGPQGDAYLRDIPGDWLIVAAWGAGAPFGRDKTAIEMFGSRPVVCLGLTKDGHPKHPLYLKSNTLQVSFIQKGSDGTTH